MEVWRQQPFILEMKRKGSRRTKRGRGPSEQDGTAAGSDGDQPTDGEADSEVQADQTNGLDSGGTSQPAGDTGEEQAGGENEAAEQAEQYLDLKDYVNKRDFGNEAAAFEEKLIDANGQTIEPDGEGIYHIYEGEAYRWSINLYAPAGLPKQAHMSIHCLKTLKRRESAYRRLQRMTAR